MGPLFLGNQSIKNQMNGKLSHAYVVGGQEGSGRSLVINQLARKALCDDLHNQPCGQCKSCNKCKSHSHPDYKEYGIEKPMSVEEVRDLQKSVLVLPNDSNRKVYVLYQSDKMLHGAQNALLKILEEPPLYVLFILVTAENLGVLETIRSRCVPMVLRPLPKDILQATLQSRYIGKVDAYQLESAIAKSSGFLGQALKILEPERMERKIEKVEDSHQFHEAVKGKGARRKIAKKLVEKPSKGTTLSESELETLACKICRNMLLKNELEIYRSCLVMEKMSKDELNQLLFYLSEQLKLGLLKDRKSNILKSIKLVEEMQGAVEGNVKGTQLIGWLTAGTMLS